MLNMITPELIKGVPAFIASCQTYEGGFGNASFPDWAFSSGDIPGASFKTYIKRPDLYLCG